MSGASTPVTRGRRCARALLGTGLLSVLLLLLPSGVLEGQDGSFPYEAWTTDIGVLGLGGGLSAYGYWLQSRLDPITPEELRELHPADINPFDRGATRNWSPGWNRRSDLARDAVSAWALLFTGLEGVRALSQGNGDDALALAAVAGETALLTLGVTAVTKGLARRKRPYAYNPALSVRERHRITSADPRKVFLSFFSGHSSGAFAAATFSSTLFQDLHGTSAWSHLVWGSSLALAGFTAVARVKAGMHYPSDVLVGSVVGAAVGYLVPALHGRDDGEENGGRRPAASRMPLHLAFRIPFG